MVTNKVLPTIFKLVGYQPVGIKPILELNPFFVTSKTAKLLLSALATYNLDSFSLNANPFVVDPFGAFGNRAQFNTSTIAKDFVSTTATLLSFAFATYKKAPFFVNNNSFGLSPMANFLTDCFVFVSHINNRSAPHKEMYNCFLSALKTQVYASAPNG